MVRLLLALSWVLSRVGLVGSILVLGAEGVSMLIL